MRVFGSVLLVILFILPLCSGTAHGETVIPLDVGGGLVTGGYFGELRHDWTVGMGGNLFIQYPTDYDLEIRLLGSMQWNDGSMTERHAEGDPDLGAEPGDLPDTFRRASFEATLLWRIERWSIGDVGVPYVGIGPSAYEMVLDYRGEAGARKVTRWEQGLHLVSGLRFYRTSGLFIGAEAKLHGIDTPREWTYGYEAAFLLGVMIGS